MTGIPIFTVHFAWLFLTLIDIMIVRFSWIVSICEIHGEYRTAGYLVFWKPSLTGSRAEKRSISVTKHGFVFWDLLSPAQTKHYSWDIAFQDCLTFLNRHMIVWFSWIFLDLWNLLKRQDGRSFSILKTLTGYRPNSHSKSLHLRH